MKKLPGLVATLALLLVAACGGDDAGGPTAAERESASAEAEASAKVDAEAKAEAAKKAKYLKEFQACKRRTGALRGALQQIESRLAIGLNNAEYGQRLGDARVAYDKIFKGPDLPYNCLLKVALPIESSMNKYVSVHTVWSDCIDDYSCVFSEGEANKKAQAGWVKASLALAKAEKGLRAMKALSA